jgi:iron transport multicopper oxidase
MTTGQNATDAAIYGDSTNTMVLEKGQVIEIILNNDDTGKHPFHLHGHNFQVISRSDENAGDWNTTQETTLPEIPMKRDTITVRPAGNLRVRFIADNPGIWLFHCHIEW